MNADEKQRDKKAGHEEHEEQEEQEESMKNAKGKSWLEIDISIGKLRFKAVSNH